MKTVALCFVIVLVTNLSTQGADICFNAENATLASFCVLIVHILAVFGL